MTTHKALIIPADPAEPARVETIDTGLKALQGLVGGLIEPVSFDTWVGWFNEEGLILNLPGNRRATLLMLEGTGVITQMYLGNALFLGDTDDGETTDVPDSLIEVAAELFTLQQLTPIGGWRAAGACHRRPPPLFTASEMRLQFIATKW